MANPLLLHNRVRQRCERCLVAGAGAQVHPLACSRFCLLACAQVHPLACGRCWCTGHPLACQALGDPSSVLMPWSGVADALVGGD